MPKENKLLYYFNKWTKLTKDEEILALSYFENSRVNRKQSLLKAGQICRYIYFITKGCVRSFYIDKKGGEHIYQIRMDDNWIGDLGSFFSQSPSKYNMEALEDTELLRISFDNLNKLFGKIPKTERYFRIIFQKAYTNALERLNATMWETAKDRYDAMLIENPEIFQRVPLVYIASYLGITPESLSRIRKQK